MLQKAVVSQERAYSAPSVAAQLIPFLTHSEFISESVVKVRLVINRIFPFLADLQRTQP